MIPILLFSDDYFISEIVDTDSCAYLGLYGKIKNLRRKGIEPFLFFQGLHSCKCGSVNDVKCENVKIPVPTVMTTYFQ